MASEDENSKGFKIQDRRRFSAEGDLKPEFSGADEPAAAKPEAPRPGGPPPSAGAHAFAQQQASPTGQQAGASQPQQAAAAKGYAAARSAAAGSHPSEAGQEQRDLAMAQQLIDILGMLREKTRGNLDHDEQALLDAILFDLRMKYVEIARRHG